MIKGKRFSLVYLDRTEPVKDSQRFRNRLVAYYRDHLYERYNDVTVKVLQKEAGIEVPYFHGFSVTDVLKKNELRDVLDSITLIYKTILVRRNTELANDWKLFVVRCLQEENVGYQLDDACGVHYFVDEEFERNRYSTLQALEDPELSGVRAAFEDAYRHLDSSPTDSKASVRSMFEALEILVKQMVKTKNLNKWIVENTLKDLAKETLATDETEKQVISEMFDGFALWVNGLHNYRHGQPDEAPVSPSEEVTIYSLSSGTSFLRLLLEIKRKI